MSTCPHARRRLFRHTFEGPRQGEHFHVVERCGECGERTRAGWVPRDEARELHGDLRSLVEDPRKKKPRANPNQGRLPL